MSEEEGKIRFVFHRFREICGKSAEDRRMPRAGSLFPARSPQKIVRYSAVLEAPALLSALEEASAEEAVSSGWDSAASSVSSGGSAT